MLSCFLTNYCSVFLHWQLMGDMRAMFHYTGTSIKYNHTGSELVTPACISLDSGRKPESPDSTCRFHTGLQPASLHFRAQTIYWWAHIFNLQIYCSGIYHGSKIKVQKANWCLSAMLWIMFHSLFTSTTFLLVTFMFGATTNPSKVSESITSNPWFCDNLNLIKDSNNQVREISFAQCFNICISCQFHPEAQIQPVIVSFYMQSSNWQEMWFWNPPSQIKLIFRVKSFTIKGHVYHRSPKPDPVRSKSSAFSSIRTRALDETLL